MSVRSYSVHVYVCTCDKCGKRVDVGENREKGIYNGAQAVRSLGWKFGKDKTVKCSECRSYDWNDHYQYLARYKHNNDVAE